MFDRAGGDFDEALAGALRDVSRAVPEARVVRVETTGA